MDKREKLLRLRDESQLGGGFDRIASQHKKGKLTARERLDLLFDEGSFYEIDSLVKHRSTNFGMEKVQVQSDGVIVGYGLNYGDYYRNVPYVFAFED